MNLTDELAARLRRVKELERSLAALVWQAGDCDGCKICEMGTDRNGRQQHEPDCPVPAAVRVLGYDPYEEGEGDA